MFSREISKGLFETAIQLAGFMAISAVRLEPDVRNSELTIGQNTYSFLSIPSVPLPILKRELVRLSFAAVLRDSIEQFSIYLHRLYENIEAEAVGQGLPMDSQAFERLGIAQQLKTLERAFGVDSAWGLRLEGFNKLRNCLAHRGGKVGPQDLTDGQALVVSWIAAGVDFSTGPAPSSSMDHLFDFKLEAGRTDARTYVSDRTKAIALGSMIVLEPRDIMEILQTFHVAGAAFSTLARSSIRHAARK